MEKSFKSNDSIGYQLILTSLCWIFRIPIIKNKGWSSNDKILTSSDISSWFFSMRSSGFKSWSATASKNCIYFWQFSSYNSGWNQWCGWTQIHVDIRQMIWGSYLLFCCNKSIFSWSNQSWRSFWRLRFITWSFLWWFMISKSW